MSIDPISSGTPPIQPPAPPAGTQRAETRASFADALGEASRPAKPDALETEALKAVEVAGQVYARLRAMDRELRFEHTSQGVRIEVYDGNGQFVQSVPATDVLKLAGGENTWLA
jgi:hypothetical protein